MYISDDYSAEEDKEEEYYEPITEVGVDGVILESHSDPRNPVANRRKKVMTQ